MPKAYLTRRYTLVASHRLYDPTKTNEENLQIFGKCANPHGHGHNYTIQVTVKGELDPTTNMLIDLPELDRTIQNEILNQYDHTNLNLHPNFTQTVPTTENFAIAIHTQLANSAIAANLAEVHIEETPNNSFTYTGPQTSSIEHHHLAQLKRNSEKAPQA